MASLPDSGEEAARGTASEELIETIMARMLPTFQRMLSQSAEHASSSPAAATAPATTPTATTPATATLSAPVDPYRHPTDHPMLPPSTVVSLEISDIDVPLASLQRDLSAADTFELDHLDDDAPFPTYDASLEPDHVPSFSTPYRNREAFRSPRSASAPSPSPPMVTSANADWNVLPPATPARAWGHLRSSPLRPSTAVPTRASATAPMVMPGAPPFIPTFNPFPVFMPSSNMVLHLPGAGLPPQRHGLGSPYYPSPDAQRTGMVSPSNRPILVADDREWIDRDFYPTGYRLDDLQYEARAGPSQVPAFKLPSRPATFGPPRTIVWPAGSRHSSPHRLLSPPYRRRLSVPVRRLCRRVSPPLLPRELSPH